ncbi:MAG TPA: hypothetical protein VHI13_09275 [Candidatus Kapabacteria bacterium]|nr:hypothetical protein [Candidatus Kapabacteria bacterium]
MNYRTLQRLTATAAATVIGIITISPHAVAQNESGRRSLNKPAFSHDWYKSTDEQYVYTFPIIRSLPPLNSAMPWDVMAGYIVADSICRFDSTGTTVENWLRTRRTMSDTLAGLLRFLYRMTEYDAATFTQYSYEVDLKRGNPSRPYRAGLFDIIAAADRAIFRCAPNRADAGALYTAFISDMVLHVRVLAIDSMPQTQHPHDFITMLYRATVQVLDTLKGGNIPSCQQQFEQDRVAKDRQRARAATALPCTYIMYCNFSVLDADHAPDVLGIPSPFYRIYRQRDTAFGGCSESCSFRMKVGQEAVVFLNFGDSKVDSTNDYFQLEIAGQDPLPVVDGRVRDVNHVWSSDLWMDYAAWRERFLTIREKIVTGNY